MRTKAVVKFFSPKSLTPPHAVRRPEQVAELVRDMLRRGWRGAALIGYYTEDGGIQLLSGTHRHAACTVLGKWIPVKVYPHSLIARCWGRLARWAALMKGRL